MNKEQLEDDQAYIRLFNQNTKLSKRVKDLEETVEDYKAVNKELHRRGRKVRKQNKRYREAFKQIKLQILFDGAIEDHRKNIIEIIDEALEGEINDSERINKRTREI